MNYRDYISDPARGCAVVVHRGIWSQAPENSLLAIERAIAAGHDVVEIDVRRSADGGLFLLHDETLTRMAGLDQSPEALTSEEIASLKLRHRDGGEDNPFTAERLPSLRDVFDLTRGRIFLHLDVKHRAVIPEVIACAKEMGVAGQVDFWGELKTEEDLAWVRDVVEPHDILFLAKSRLNAPDVDMRMGLLSDLSPAVCEIDFDRLDELAELKSRSSGMALWVNTLDTVSCAGFTDTAALRDPEAIWGSLIDAGVSVIQTDEAAVLKSYLASRRA